MYFPEGERAYQCMLFAVETEYDSLLLDLFSELPTSAVFCKVDRFVLMALYIPFLYIAQSMIRRVLSYLQKKELIHRYINSIIEYSYRPD